MLSSTRIGQTTSAATKGPVTATRPSVPGATCLPISTDQPDGVSIGGPGNLDISSTEAFSVTKRTLQTINAQFNSMYLSVLGRVMIGSRQVVAGVLYNVGVGGRS